MVRFAPLILAVAAVVYFSGAYVPVGVSYLRVLAAARGFAATASMEPPSPGAWSALVETVRRETGFRLDPDNVRVWRDEQAGAVVYMDFQVPLNFPLLGSQREIHFAIATGPPIERN